MILLIGSENDPHFVGDPTFGIGGIYGHIKEQNVDAVMLKTDRESLLATQFSYHSKTKTAVIRQGDTVISSADIKAVFSLMPMYYRKGFSFTQEQNFWHQTWRESLTGLYQVLKNHAFFVNSSVYQSLSAQNKIDFFEAADFAEMDTPDTIISNHKEDIINFFNDNQDVVIKTMHQIYLEHNGSPMLMLVKRVKKEELESFESSNECPVFLQQAIDKAYDVRAVIVGDKIFGCKIDASRSDAGRQDWRAYDLPNTVHEAIDIPQDTQEKLLKVLNYFKLDYACLDLCVDKNGKYWLLDVNPFGRFMWIELGVGMPISRAIADMLVQKMK